MARYPLFEGHNAVRALLPLTLVVALPVVLLIQRHGFDGLYGQDAFAYYGYAMETVRHNLQALQLPAPFFWPPGYPLLVALLSFIVGPQPLAAQIVSLVAGALVPLLTALLAAELWRGENQEATTARIALAAGLIAALTPQLWQSSAVSMSDTAALAAATLGILALLRYERTQRGALLALASAALAFAMLTRMLFAALALIAAFYAFILLARRSLKTAAAHAAPAAAAALLVLAPLLVTLGQPQALPGGEGQAFLGHFGPNWWRLRHALQNEFVTGNGHLRYSLVNGLYYALTPAHRYYFTPLLAPLLLPGLWRLWKQRTLRRFLILLGWPVVIYLVLIGYPAQNFRFALAFLPPLAILVAAGLDLAWQAARGARPLLLLALAASALWMIYGGWTLSESFMARKQADLAAVRWVQNQIPAQAQLFTFGITLTVEHYTELEVHDVYHHTPASINSLLQQRPPAYLLLDTGNIAQQWAQHAPGQNYRYLQQEVGLNPLGDHRQYTLFAIAGAE